jgi:hypothetical protein
MATLTMDESVITPVRMFLESVVLVSRPDIIWSKKLLTTMLQWAAVVESYYKPWHQLHAESVFSLKVCWCSLVHTSSGRDYDQVLLPSSYIQAKILISRCLRLQAELKSLPNGLPEIDVPDLKNATKYLLRLMLTQCSCSAEKLSLLLSACEEHSAGWPECARKGGLRILRSCLLVGDNHVQGTQQVLQSTMSRSLTKVSPNFTPSC